MTDTRRRVKLYALNADRQWDDRGTGHVSSSYVERLRGMSLLVRAESDSSLLLESKIQPDTAYQKQQETLIVWSEGDNYDLALSFQERAGCDEIWAKICQVQGKDPSVDITQEIVEEEDERFDEGSEMSNLLFELPPCEVDRLDEINEIIATCLPFPMKREKLAAILERENYIKKMLELFHLCEETQNLKALHKLYEIFKNIFMLNKNPLFEVMLGDEQLLFDVVGVFEYDPAQPQPKRHREFLRSAARFKQVIPFANSELVHKIHQTYRVQYIQDVVLPTPSVLEENMLSTLSSFIFFNKVEIVSIIQEDDKFLRELFALITDEHTEEERRRDLVLFLKEFCIYSQNLQQQNREAFFKALSSLGILPTLEVTLAMDDLVIKSSSVDILTYLVEFSPGMVREYALQQEAQTDEEQLIINIIIEQMICDPDPDLAMAVQLSSTLRLLLDPDNMLATGGLTKSEKTEFLNYFYKHCMHVLVSRLVSASADTQESTGPAPQTGQQAQLCSLILELLSFCVEHHSYQIRGYIVQNDLLRKALALVKSRHTFLVLSALRFMRRIIGLKDENYYRYIINENLFEPIVEVFRANDGRYNLLDSAIIEMFEYIRAEEIKTLCVHIIDKFGKQLEKIDYVRTFKDLRRQYEQHQDRMIDRGALENTVILRNNRFRRDARQMDDDEEMWFNNDDDETDPIESNLNDSLNYKLETEFDQFNNKMEKKATLGCIPYPDLESVENYDEIENVKTNTNSKANSPRRSTACHQGSPTGNCLELQAKMKALVDYEGDSDEEADAEEAGENGLIDTTKRQRLSSS